MHRINIEILAGLAVAYIALAASLLLVSLRLSAVTTERDYWQRAALASQEQAVKALSAKPRSLAGEHAWIRCWGNMWLEAVRLGSSATNWVEIGRTPAVESEPVPANSDAITNLTLSTNYAFDDTVWPLLLLTNSSDGQQITIFEWSADNTLSVYGREIGRVVGTNFIPARRLPLSPAHWEWSPSNLDWPAGNLRTLWPSPLAPTP